MNKNTIGQRNVVFSPDVEIVATFKGGKKYSGLLGELKEWAIENDVDAPLSCHTSEGRHGLFPCIVAETNRMAGALSVLVGARIVKDDGATFATRNQMKQVARSMARAGFRVSAVSCLWGITELPYEEDSSAKPKPKDQPELPLEAGPWS